MQQLKFQLCPADNLFVSQPNPQWFGNSSNPTNNQYWTNPNWLKSRFHFSFAEYSDPLNNQFGVLRVLNDDLVQPERGFGSHPHSNMEIITYVIDGKITHQDSKGNKETLGRGSIQYMTAGSGVIHSEHNLEKDTPCRFIQMWILPIKQSLPVNYSSYIANDPTIRKNRLQHLVSDVNNKKVTTPAKIYQDANLYVSEFDTPITFQLSENRQAYIVCIEGALKIDGEFNMKKHDGAKLFGAWQMTINPIDSVCHILIIEMAKKK